jgi:hypothetical protein
VGAHEHHSSVGEMDGKGDGMGLGAADGTGVGIELGKK